MYNFRAIRIRVKWNCSISLHSLKHFFNNAMILLFKKNTFTTKKDGSVKDIKSSY